MRNRNLQAAVMRTYGLLGLIVSLVAVLYFVLKKFQITIDSTDAIILTIAASGAGLFFASRVLIEIYKQKEIYDTEISKIENLVHSLIRSWSGFEEEGAHLLDIDGDSGPVPIRRIMKELSAKKIIDSKMLEDLEFALKVRNNVVHGLVDEVGRKDIVASLDAIAEARAVMAQSSR